MDMLAIETGEMDVLVRSKTSRTIFAFTGTLIHIETISRIVSFAIGLSTHLRTPFLGLLFLDEERRAQILSTRLTITKSSLIVQARREGCSPLLLSAQPD
jgi:hypothetical protein